MNKFYDYRAPMTKILEALGEDTLPERALNDRLEEITGIHTANAVGYTNFAGYPDDHPFLKKRPDCRRWGRKKPATPKEFPLQTLLNRGKVIWLSPPNPETGDLYEWDNHPEVPASERPVTGGYRKA